MTIFGTDNILAVSRTSLITGWVLSGLFIAFMIFDGVIKLGPMQVVRDTMLGMGWDAPDATWRTLGILALILTALYAWRPTSMLGAILLTGYLGGAIATQLRAGTPVFSHLLFGVYLGALMWGGLWLREPAVRALLVLR
ncbi:MAG: DoxX family protein [Gammaproteobacteria bacterium]|nr:DoxX family protein [Alphaproteobacteria bacterium]MBU2407836.1 DoxX family protein [Gammaproteobacteria bacterium]